MSWFKLFLVTPAPRLTPFPPCQGPDFGYVTREPQDSSVSGLDSFGNLEVSPPVVADGKEYPLGRILIGGNLPG